MAECFRDRSCFDWWDGGCGQSRAGIQLVPVNASRRTSNSFTACFLAVDITDQTFTKYSAPVVERKQPEIFWRTLTILMSRSAWLLSKETVKSVAKRSTSSWCEPNRLSSRRGSVRAMRSPVFGCTRAGD